MMTRKATTSRNKMILSIMTTPKKQSTGKTRAVREG